MTTTTQTETFEEISERLDKRFEFRDTRHGWVAISKETGQKTLQQLDESEDEFMSRLDRM